MKKIIALVLALTLCLGLFAACAPAGNDNTTGGGNNPPATGNNNNETTLPKIDLSGTYKITMWVSEKEGVAAQFQEQIDAFEAANPGIIIEAAIEGVTEADAGSKVVADVASAPDIYCFAQDQLARLVQAGALAELGGDIAALVKAENDAGSVAGATVGGKLYAYPMTSDNGYYLYYDKSIISEADADSLEAIIAACEKSGKKFRFALENAWYTASFFFATGCHSNWSMTPEGEYNAIDDDFNSAAGLIAMKGMQKLAQSSCYDSDADTFTDAGAIVTGIWNAGAAADHFGDNLGATDLPSFEVDGTSYHLGSYSGFKLMGVKPQTDAYRSAVLALLAQYLTNEQNQLARFESFEWGPSNLKAQASDSVQANASLAALALQNGNENSIPQGQIHGSWWDIAKVLGAQAKAATGDADLQKALDDYKAAVDAVLNMSDDAKLAWSVIGDICGSNWDTDFPMTKVNDTTYESEALNLEAGKQFKVRQGASWDVNYGADGVAGGDNIVVETAGTYKVQLIIDGENVSVNLIAAE